MHILVSNDDGYLAEGIRKLNLALGGLVPLRVFQSEPDVHYVVGGTPTDCVHIAISGYFDFEFDLVCSGINDGANLGDDTLYSGTVAAAIEGRFLGLPTVAFSLCMDADSGRHFDTAARVAHAIVARLLEQPLERGITLNVNVPDLPWNELKGIRATRLGGRHRSKPIVPVQDPKGKRMYWIGPAGAGQDAGEGTDFHAIATGFVSVTPLQIDLTRHAALPTLNHWLKPLV
jgi:5'-nucleotidase